MADDDDPMAFLAAQRSKLAAMHRAAEEQAAVAATVAGVRNRMHAIEALASESESSKAPVVFEEMDVDAWKRKIAALSAPVTAKGASELDAPHASSAASGSSRVLVERPSPGLTTAPVHSNAISHQEHAEYLDYASAPTHKPQEFQVASHRQSAAAPQKQSASTEVFCAQLGLCTKCFDIPCCCR